MFNIEEVAQEFLPLFDKMVVGKYAVSIAGSVGKEIHDERSDIDFRLFYEKRIADKSEWDRLREEFNKKANKFLEIGVKVDDFWPRAIHDVDNMIDTWFNGEGKPIDFNWTVWGYHSLTDIANQYIIKDEYGIIDGWHKRLEQYPLKLKEKTVKENLSAIKYWRDDYHYQSKVFRGDIVFLSALASKLVHHIIIILYALNEKYYVGDGNNLRFTRDFEIIPIDFESRIESILYPKRCDRIFETQREELCLLIDEVIKLSNSWLKSL